MLSRLLIFLGLVLWVPVSFADTDQDSPAPEPEAEAQADGSDAEDEPSEDGDHSSGEHASGDHGDHSEHGGGGGGGGVDPLASDLDLAIFSLIVFGLLAALLSFVAWEPIMKALAAREEGITGEIEAAKAAHEEAKALLAQHEAKIASATDDVKAMLEEARRDGEQTKAQIVAEARKAAEAEKQRAVREVEQARDAAIKHLAEESGNLAIDLAAKVVKQEISSERQGEIIGEAINRLAAAQPSDN